VDVEEASPPIRADEDKLRRVMDNLVKNAPAIEYGPGVVKVAVESDPQKRENVHIVVADSGSGVPEGADVFALFETTKLGGTGLGLSICRQIVLAHGGGIEHARQVPAGTIFRVELPKRGPTSRLVASSSCRRDEPSFTSLAETLRDDGHEVLTMARPRRSPRFPISRPWTSVTISMREGPGSHWRTTSIRIIGVPVLLVMAIRPTPAAQILDRPFLRLMQKPVDHDSIHTLIIKWRGHGRPPSHGAAIEPPLVSSLAPT
jgi:hypothetical protein